MSTPKASVVICAHNPRADYLARVIAALQAQTLARSDWELLLVDNASANPLEGLVDLSWHPNARHIREDELGLTPARLRGIAESRGDILVFVDDDNVLAADYLENALAIDREWPLLGAWGGTVEGEFEVEPEPWMEPLLGYLCLRRFSKPIWSNNPDDGRAQPNGAGLCVRRTVATAYAAQIDTQPWRRTLDRTGQSLLSSGDIDLVLTSCDLGLGIGNFPELALTHLIPARRVTQDYMIRLLQGITTSNALLRYYRSGVLPQEPSRLRTTVRYLLTLLTEDRHRALIYKASKEAMTTAARFARSAAYCPLPSPPQATSDMLRSILGCCANVVARTAGASWLIRKAALAPIETKTPVFERALSAIARRAPLGACLIETNGGISNDLRLLLPGCKHALLFGHPRNHEAERATLALAHALAGRSAAFLDVGANDGLFAFTIAASSPRARAGSIHCFEPAPDLFARLDENLRRNRIGARAINAAVGSKKGTTRFYRNLSDDSSGSLTTYFTGKHETIPIEVSVVTLGDYLVCNNLERVCAKIDVESAGLAVWEGIGKAFDRIDWLIMEMLEPEIDANLPRRIMADTGWYAYYICDFDLVQSIEGEFDYRAPFYNWLLCTTPPDALRDLLAQAPFHVVGAKRKGGGHERPHVSH